MIDRTVTELSRLARIRDGLETSVECGGCKREKPCTECRGWLLSAADLTMEECIEHMRDDMRMYTDRELEEAKLTAMLRGSAGLATGKTATREGDEVENENGITEMTIAPSEAIQAMLERNVDPVATALNAQATLKAQLANAIAALLAQRAKIDADLASLGHARRNPRGPNRPKPAVPAETGARNTVTNPFPTATTPPNAGEAKPAKKAK